MAESSEPVAGRLSAADAQRDMMIANDAHPGVTVRDDSEHARYVIEVDGVRAGFAAYEIRDGQVRFVHTVIDSAHEGRGLGSRLARAALDDVARRGGTVVAICPFIAAWIERHPDYRHLVDENSPHR